METIRSPAAHEFAGNLACGLEQAARVVAQVKDQGSHALALQFVQGFVEFTGRRLVKLRDANITNAILQNLRVLHAVDFDHSALNGVVLDAFAGVFGLLTEDGDRDFRARIAAKLTNGFGQRHFVGYLPLNFR